MKIKSIKTFMDIFITTLFLCASCCVANQNIRELAIQNKSETFFNNIIEYYSRCYYRLPYNKEELIDFLNHWQKADSESFWVKDFCDEKNMNIIDYLKNGKIAWERYDDSLFCYIAETNSGCCMYGHPYYWIKHPELYPTERLDYWKNFNTAAYLSNGEFDFDFSSNQIDSEVDALKNRYRFSLKAEIVCYESDSVQMIPVKVILTYNVKDDEIVISSEPPKCKNMYVSDGNNMLKSIGKEDVNLIDNSSYLREIKQIIKKNLPNDKNFSKINITAPFLFCDGMDNS